MFKKITQTITSTAKPENLQMQNLSSDSPSSASLNHASSLFYSQPQALKTELPRLSALPEDLLKLIPSYLGNFKDALSLAIADRRRYQMLYPTIKEAMVKFLKHLVEEDATADVKKLLAANPYLLVRKDHWDPKGIAYQHIKTTPYQDTLADPFKEEMRMILEMSFPLSTEEKTEQVSANSSSDRNRQIRLKQAALQAEGFKNSSYDKYREKHTEIMRLTSFAYESYLKKFTAWERGEASAQSVDDAWARIGIVQDRWPKRLRKIFSIVGTKYRTKITDQLPQDLPEPRFYNEPDAPLWLPGTTKGCQFLLLCAEEKEDIKAAPFKEKLDRKSQGYPLLVCHGEGENANYYLYGPEISLKEDKAEWQLIQLDEKKDKAVIELIRSGGVVNGQDVSPIDFGNGFLSFDPLYNALYQVAHRNNLHVGSGWLSSFSVFIDLSPGLKRGIPLLLRQQRSGMEVALSNSAAVTTLYEKRTQNLTRHLKELEAYLPSPSIPEPQIPSPSPPSLT